MQANVGPVPPTKMFCSLGTCPILRKQPTVTLALPMNLWCVGGNVQTKNNKEYRGWLWACLVWTGEAAHLYQWVLHLTDALSQRSKQSLGMFQSWAPPCFSVFILQLLKDKSWRLITHFFLSWWCIEMNELATARIYWWITPSWEDYSGTGLMNSAQFWVWCWQLVSCTSQHDCPKVLGTYTTMQSLSLYKTDEFLKPSENYCKWSEPTNS